MYLRDVLSALRMQAQLSPLCCLQPSWDFTGSAGAMTWSHPPSGPQIWPDPSVASATGVPHLCLGELLWAGFSVPFTIPLSLALENVPGFLCTVVEEERIESFNLNMVDIAKNNLHPLSQWVRIPGRGIVYP